LVFPVGLQSIIVYFPPKARVSMLKILMEMEFNSRTAPKTKTPHKVCTPAPNFRTVYAGAEPARPLPSASTRVVVVAAKRARFQAISVA